MSKRIKIKSTDALRRKFIQGFGLMVGGAAASQLITGNVVAVAVAYTPNNESALSDGKILTKAQLTLLKSICSIVIPKTSTPGAAEVDVHGFIDNLLFHCYDEFAQQRIIKLLVLIDSTAKQIYAKSFVEVGSDKQFTLMNDLDLGQFLFSQQQRGIFKSLKQLICFGYYTSEVGATVELRYDPVPGGFRGGIPYKDSDVAWATRGLFG